MSLRYNNNLLFIGAKKKTEEKPTYISNKEHGFRIINQNLDKVV
jgi:hypothetical protein